MKKFLYLACILMLVNQKELKAQTLYIYNYCPIQFNIQVYNSINDTFIGISATSPAFYDFGITMTDSSFIKIWPHEFWPIITVGNPIASGYDDLEIYPLTVYPMTIPFKAVYVPMFETLGIVVLLLIPEDAF